MLEILLQASFWFLLALISTIIATKLRLATALTEIAVGAIASLAITGTGISIGENDLWIKFIASVGAIMLTFLAGAELEPDVLKSRWKETMGIGLIAFIAPFLGCTAVAHYILGWSAKASWLTGVALSTTSVAVVYAVMLELGLNKTEFGKVILAACFVNDLGTVIALGLIFSPFTTNSLIFMVVMIVVAILVPFITPKIFKKFGNKPSEFETKYLLFILFGIGALALWSGSEAVLPAYIIGMVLAGTVGKDSQLIRRLRTLTIGFLTPIYFLRAGYFVSIPSIIAAPIALLVLLSGKMITKIAGVYPVTKLFEFRHKEGMYTTLLMSTGLTFGSISALFGLTHGIIDQNQYSLLIAAVIGSAVIPTIIANAFYLPKYLLPKTKKEG
ncbi:cation:proton antiporter [Thermodesulfovibrio yellowstonii]|uniref:Kef-type K+ transport system, membrane component n=1 Tax=Thermodesulfovibrio yellowstonii (strain ATCC 51303 / DSM 11347 / YP87) TaxID=289376 RepID=B5YHL6_THEYD|nr:cation:proton antiporter [Thermodesulfovibrio yellowstonii]ACI21370.1 Kef-type K+ transport system, membrane component [Thermodesulfovibrio yellowstonii DSM 11347]MDI6865618.1 cation:proton antiporter [Thermodesulfovibrio yellowstonii]